MDIRLRDTPQAGVERLDFMAQEEMVHIVPNFSMERVDFLSGRFGPFEPPEETKVPLWLALLLREAGRCTIKTPSWMNTERLRESLQEEEKEAGFSSFPFHYSEMAKMLCRYRADVKECTEVERLLLCIDNLRDEKIRLGISTLKTSTQGYRMTSLSALEISSIRSTMTKLMDIMRKYDSTKTTPPEVLSGDINAIRITTGQQSDDNQIDQPAGDVSDEEPHDLPVVETPQKDLPAPDAATPGVQPGGELKRRRLRR